LSPRSEDGQVAWRTGGAGRRNGNQYLQITSTAELALSYAVTRYRMCAAAASFVEHGLPSGEENCYDDKLDWKN
jgi:hypothetical protein